MAANFNEPTVSTTYTDFPTQIIDNIDAALQMLSVGSPTNVPTGAIKWDATLNRLRKFDGSNYGDLTSTYDFNAALSATALDMGDSNNTSGNTNAILLGASDDLRIFHDGNHSFIRDFNGTGNLKITTNQLDITNNGNSEFMAKFIQNGSVELYEDNIKRIETTNAGAAITGNLTTTGQAVIGTNITTDGSGGVADRIIRIGAGRTSNGNSYLDLVSDATNTTYGARLIRGNTGVNTNTTLQHRGTGELIIAATDAGKIALKTNANTRLFINQTGQVSIGGTDPQKLFEVESAVTPEMIIRTSAASSHDAKLTLRGSRTGAPTDINQIIFESNDTGGGNYAAGSRLGSIICGKKNNNTTRGFLDFRLNNTTITDGSLGTSNASKLFISGANEVGISTTDPQRLLQLSSADQTSIIRLHSTDTTLQTDNRVGMIEFSTADSSASGIGAFIDVVARDNNGRMDMRFGTGTAGSATEMMRLNRSGQLIFGRTTQLNSRVGTGNVQPLIQVHHEEDGSMSLTRYVNQSGQSGRLFIQKARGTIASPLVVVDGDNTGEVRFSGYDGTNFANGCTILNRVNGTVSANTLPSDLEFYIRDASGDSQELLTLNHDRFVGINKPVPLTALHVKQLTDNAGGLRVEDAGDNNTHCTIDVTDTLTSFTARRNNNHGNIRFQSNNGTTTIENLRLIGTSGVGIGATTNATSDKLTVTGGRISTDSFVIAGRGSGGAALTHNDGYGNAQITFNHVNGTPEQNGVAGRIDMNTDSSGGVATMTFGLVNQAVAGTAINPSDAVQFKRGTEANLGVGSGTTLRNQVIFPTGSTTFPAVSFSGDSDTGISRSGTNRMNFITNNVERVRINNSGLEVMSNGEAKAINTAKAWVVFKGTDTFAIQQSYNVDSITDINVGQYRVTYDTNMTNAQHQILITVSLTPSGNNTHGVPYIVSRATNTHIMRICRDENSNDVCDKDVVSVAVFDT
tara:strand:+ start:4079 stop:6988 length:2910 start_codon:yes stop_codon:yes gene_type:complete